MGHSSNGRGLPLSVCKKPVKLILYASWQMHTYVLFIQKE